MTKDRTLQRIAGGRTDAVVDLLDLPDWKAVVESGKPSVLQWLVYYGDTTALKFLERQGADLGSMDLNRELCDSAFYGHWTTCDLLLRRGADPNYRHPETSESPLHCALCKAGRPYFLYVLRVLLEAGADPNTRTEPGVETGGFMRDVRCCGETPLHRAAAYGDVEMIDLLLEYGADKEARDDNGDSPITWASRHLRPGKILSRLAFGDHHIGARTIQQSTSDHGQGWGNGMERSLLGDYLPDD